MRRMLFSLVVIACSCAQAYAAQGTVVYRQSGCDYFVVQTTKGYDVLEWFGGWDPDKGDVLVGNFETYGMHDIRDSTIDESVTVWVEEYWLSRADALENLVEHCE
jgi:hypothetical protein